MNAEDSDFKRSSNKRIAEKRSSNKRITEKSVGSSRNEERQACRSKDEDRKQKKRRYIHFFTRKKINLMNAEDSDFKRSSNKRITEKSVGSSRNEERQACRSKDEDRKQKKRRYIHFFTRKKINLMNAEDSDFKRSSNKRITEKSVGSSRNEERQACRSKDEDRKQKKRRYIHFFTRKKINLMNAEDSDFKRSSNKRITEKSVGSSRNEERQACRSKDEDRKQKKRRYIHFFTRKKINLMNAEDSDFKRSSNKRITEKSVGSSRNEERQACRSKDEDRKQKKRRYIHFFTRKKINLMNAEDSDFKRSSNKRITEKSISRGHPTKE
ncbi:hypothetical protein M513_13069 [Trichuris suis]|uniref:Uncharacterized protein n=1 Tax=Trichuris suis TaxID=68888 RepID=A0A085LM69_9BILA|nr:hypothetical protein M513_13069 [Trichuris suis]